MCGVGKSTVVRYIAHDLIRKKTFNPVFILDCGTRESMLGDFFQLGERLEIDNGTHGSISSDTENDKIKNICLKLLKYKPLLIFDNADDVLMVQAFMKTLEGYNNRIYMFVTSRNLHAF